MAVDATGTPTSLGIPTLNTAADAPSGKGVNAIVAAIDALLVARVSKPSGIALGEVPVWDGSAFVRSSTTKISTTSLPFTGTPTGLKFLRDDYSWQTVSAGPTITRSLFSNPPASPANGDIWIAVDSLTAATYSWQFQWVNGSTNANKWEFIGGTPIVSGPGGSATTTGTSFIDFTSGPAIVIPRAGVYTFSFGVLVQQTTATALTPQVKLVGTTTGAVFGPATFHGQLGTGGFGAYTTESTTIALAAGETLKLQVASAAATNGSWSLPFIRLLPTRVS